MLEAPKNQLTEKEKRYFTKKWAAQEMQIKKILRNTIGVYDDIDSMVSLPKIPALELEEYSGSENKEAEAREMEE